MENRAVSDEDLDVSNESESELLSFAEKMLSELEQCHSEQISVDDTADDDIFSDFD